jgi:arabinosyltransferase C
LDSAPIVAGLFTEESLTTAGGPQIEVTTVPYATKPTGRQTLAWTIAALAALASLVLVGIGRFPTLSPSSIRHALGHAQVADAAVAISLLAWWVLAPLIWDDGWIVARERAYRESGGFTNYFSSFGVNLPNDYWLEWVQHWVVVSSNSLLVWRLPALVVLCGLWILCRWILRRSLGELEDDNRLAIWVAATAFVGCSIAWGMTLRPEPFTALLVTAVLATAIAFRARPSAGPLALAAVLVPLALAAHHTGITALAPLLAVAPTIWTWLRDHRFRGIALVLSSAALLFVLAPLGADLAVRLADAGTTATYGGSGDHWYQELRRYYRLDGFPYGTPPRRGSVALIALIGLFFLLRRRRARDIRDVPARSLLIALPLFIVTWSKLPWHFGALIGVTAVAAGTEAFRLHLDAERVTALSKRALLFIAAMVVAGGWALAFRTHWNPVDLGTLDWRFAFERAVPLDIVVALVPLLALLFLVGIGIRKRDDLEVYRAPWRVASWAAPILMVPLLGITFTVFAVDTARSPWTVRRQNLETLVGRESCGLGNHLIVASESIGATRLSDLLRPESVRALAAPEVLPYFPCVRQPLLRGGVAEAPDLVLSTPYERIPFLFGTSPFVPVLDLYRFERLRVVGPFRPDDLELFAIKRSVPGARELAADSRTVVG